MGSELFRREVMDARSESWLGSVHLSTPRLAWLMALLGGAAVLALALALAFGSHTRKQRVQGQVLPVGGLRTVAAGASGVLVRRLVGEGDEVVRGQPLLEISADIDTPGTDSGLSTQVAGALGRQRMQLQEDLADLEPSERRQAGALRAQIDSLQRQVAAAGVERDLRTRQADAAMRTLERIRPLQKEKIASDVQIQQYEDQALSAQAQRSLAERNLLDLEGVLGEARHQLDGLPLRMRERRSEIDRALSEITRALAVNQARGTILVRAPGAGTVSGLAVDEGQAVMAGQRLLSIAPQGMRLQAELWVPSRAVGTLQPGDRVAMRYQAFPYQTFGQQYGYVSGVPGSALAPSEMLARNGIDPGEPVYRVMVTLDRQDVVAGGRSFALRPHMLLDADLLLERRRLYQLLLEPFQRARVAHPVATRPQEAP